ncbi:unnamed protein product [Leptidea sinapis]|uniref:Elongation of very long chain fatty acids protein n=1 Tax=Leptidea sinapis TaxID=189913 RepID=A0A5E4Q875_9NEOP|nr:unnamed protein product [Leptidea sinapis]
MATLIRTVWKGYGFIFDEIAVYLLFVLKIGPNFMKNRQPFNVEKLMILHNLSQVIACAYVFYETIVYAWGWKYKWICEPIDFSNTPDSLNVAGFVYHYYILKYLDLLDTIFFILRKKTNQVSFLHIYHHTGMVMLTWGAVTYFPGGHGTLIGMVNSFVHIVMYGYYLLTVIVPSTKNSVWLKKHITQMQIIQLAWCCLHMGILAVKTDCQYPRWVALVFLPNDLFMLTLFIDFYIKSYILKPSARKAKPKEEQKECEDEKVNHSIEDAIVRQRKMASENLR